MKKTFVSYALVFSALVSCALLTGLSARAQSDKYVAAMQKNLSLFDSSKTIDQYQSLAATFDRIGDAEKTQWLPFYYAALAQTLAGWNPDLKDKDANSRKINAYLAKAEAIEKNSETYAVENMSATQQMLVDPQNRWMTNGKDASEALEKGLALDPNNPRLYYLQGMSMFNTPAQFGGGKDKAKPLFEKSVALFKAAQPKPLYPTWGQKQASDMLAQCQ
ncbi:MAG TPA: hypothetical protein VNV35_02540 [Puia sp.]|jgi:hypothetical protein|nr:hypothetical protein [Puia sp.]